MITQDLDTEFESAVEKINKHKDPFPADLLLRLYAYYKRATNNAHSPGSSNPLINAFKTNALFQTRGMTVEEAKQLYVDAVKDYFERLK